MPLNPNGPGYIRVASPFINAGGLSSGTYRVDLHINGELLASGEFTVQQPKTSLVPQISEISLQSTGKSVDSIFHMRENALYIGNAVLHALPIEIKAIAMIDHMPEITIGR